MDRREMELGVALSNLAELRAELDASIQRLNATMDKFKDELETSKKEKTNG